MARTDFCLYDDFKKEGENLLELRKSLKALDDATRSEIVRKKDIALFYLPEKRYTEKREKDVYKRQGIPGVEVYYQEDDMRKREHMILLAKDYQGYIAIGKIVTLSNERIDSKGFPRVNKKMLEDVLAELGAGHIIATSACVGGILAVPLLEAEELEEEYEKLEKESKGLLNHDSPSYCLLYTSRCV